MRYRKRLEIIADMLDAVGDGANKTRIMYFANLSYKLLGKYLKKTLDAGLVSFDDGHYEVTEKGQVFLERFSSFSSRYSRLERELEEASFERKVLERMCALVVSEHNDSRERGRRR